jgi:hypothetical protein
VAEAVVVSGLVVGEQRVLVNRSMWRDYVDVHHFTRCSRSDAAKFGTDEFSLRRLFIIKLVILILTLCSILRPHQLIIVLLLHEYALLNVGHLGVLLRQVDLGNRKGSGFAAFAVVFSGLISAILFILESLMLSLLNLGC